MRSIKLTLNRSDLLLALATLAATKRHRTSPWPVRLHFDEGSSGLQIMEDRAIVSAEVAAKGYWPPVGATVDLLALKRAVGHCLGIDLDLHVLVDEIMIQSGGWHVRLKLQKFGPESGSRAEARDELPELPLLKWGGIPH